MANVKFKRVTTAQQTTEAIEDGKLLFNTDTKKIFLDNSTTRLEMIPADSALSTTSTNPIQNKALTNSIVNDLATAQAVTADYIPCGTKVVKELNTSISTWTDITSEITKNWSDISTDMYALYNPITKEVKISFHCGVVGMPNSSTILTLPTIYRPSTTIVISNGAMSKPTANASVFDWCANLIIVNTDGTIKNGFPVAQSSYLMQAQFSYIVR